MWEESELRKGVQSEKVATAEAVRGAVEALENKLPPEPVLDNVFPSYDIDPTIYQYKIAMVPMNIPFGSFEAVEKHGVKPLRIRENDSDRIANALVKNVRQACAAGARLICCSEYCYPILRHNRIKRKLADLASKYGAYIVAGSYVDTEPEKPCYNTCLVFSPHRSEPYEQYKNGLGNFKKKRESINIPSPAVEKVFQTELGVIVILVCVDVQDARMQRVLEILNNDRNAFQAVDLVIVPSYTSDPDDMQLYCEKLSESTGTSVVFVHDSSYGSHSTIYLCGESQSRSLEQIKNTARDHGPVHIFSFDLAKLRNKRRKQLAKKAITRSLDRNGS